MFEKKPTIIVAIFGFNRYTEQLNGRIAMVAIIIIFIIEALYGVKITKLLFG